MGYSYKSAMEVLSDVDKNRIIACYINMANANSAVNWDKATAAYGSASVESMKKCMQNIVKKIASDDGEEVIPTPDTQKVKRGRKRKADTNDAEGTPTKPAPKKKANEVKVKAEIADEDGAKEDSPEVIPGADQ